jgi:putative nucleotidyltransferase with HDIG domain
MDTNLSASREALALDIIRQLRASGHTAYLVGGCVRDRLLGVSPKDFDVATSAQPEQILREFPGARSVGAQFGVVLVSSRDGATVEVATFRSDGIYSDGRHPEQVVFESDPARDAERRDFTINGLMEDPWTGEILDFVGGRADLSAKVIRAIGDPKRRFQEDHLRMLRAVRFAARLEFSIEAKTLSAIRREAACIVRISPERIRDELVKILVEGAARRGFELLDESGLLALILPEVKAFQGVAQPPQYHPEGDVWNHVMLMLEGVRGATPTLALGVLLHDVGKPPTFRVADRIRFDGHAEVGAVIAEQVLIRLRFSNEEIERVTALVANHMRFKDTPHMKLSTLKCFLRLPFFDEHLALHKLDCLASHGNLGIYELIRVKLRELSLEDLRPAPLLTGEDLILAGYRPGPAFGRALSAVETGQLDGEIRTREEAFAVAKTSLSGDQELASTVAHGSQPARDK